MFFILRIFAASCSIETLWIDIQCDVVQFFELSLDSVDGGPRQVRAVERAADVRGRLEAKLAPLGNGVGKALVLDRVEKHFDLVRIQMLLTATHLNQAKCGAGRDVDASEHVAKMSQCARVYGD